MKIKKILAVISALTLGATMAVSASAETTTIDLDTDKILWGDPEDKGNLRLELYNQYGGTKLDAPFTTSDIVNASAITVTFTLEGAPEGDFTAGFYFADGSWTVTEDHGSSTTISGDGTYSVTTADFGSWDEETPILANGATVLVIDIEGMGEAAGVSKEEDYDMSVVKFSDVSIEITTVEEPEAEEEPADSTEEAEPEDAEEDGAAEAEEESEAADSEEADAEESDDEKTTAAAADTDTADEEESGMSTGLIAGIVVACVAVVGVIAAVVIKKKK